tara:strand:- start:662 stop:1333 length:672 start_codon:yes stop_codon:yes gene_type:complete
MKQLFIIIFLKMSLNAQIDYMEEIQSIFNDNCIQCHGEVRAGALRLRSYNELMNGNSNNGPIVIPFDADSSLLYKVLLNDPVEVLNEPICCRMPKNEPPLSIPKRKKIYDWINEGALYVEDSLSVYENNNIEYFKIYQNYPNPFNPNTTFFYDILDDSNIIISIYNLKGQKIKSSNLSNLSPGTYSFKWNGTDDNGESVVAGVYLYQLQTKGFVKTKKMILLK